MSVFRVKIDGKLVRDSVYHRVEKIAGCGTGYVNLYRYRWDDFLTLSEALTEILEQHNGLVIELEIG